jgi:hypothetical protein
MFISTHSQQIYERVVAEMSKVGYRIEVSSDFDSDTTSFDGFIFASSPGVAQLFKDFKPVGRKKNLTQ